MKKLEDSDTEEYWDEEFMENYKKKFVYSIVNYKTKNNQYKNNTSLICITNIYFVLKNDDNQ